MESKLQKKIKLAKFEQEEFGVARKVQRMYFLDLYDLEILEYYTTTKNVSESQAVRELLRIGFEKVKGE